MTAETNTLTSVEQNTISQKATAARILANYVGGRWVSAQASGLLDVTNPANGAVLARVPLSGVAEVEGAVAAASAALPDWRGRSVGERTEFIYALREKFRQRIDELAASVTRESGKVLSDARAEITRSIEVLEVACAAPMTMQGRILEGVARGINTETIRQPIGVCAAITPFNFPAMVPMWFLPFAIVCGNTQHVVAAARPGDPRRADGSRSCARSAPPRSRSCSASRSPGCSPVSTSRAGDSPGPSCCCRWSCRRSSAASRCSSPSAAAAWSASTSTRGSGSASPSRRSAR